MKNKWMIFFLLGSFLSAGCNSAISSRQEEAKIVTTIAIIGDVVQNIDGENIQITVLVSPGNDPHGFVPTPQDLKVIEEADLIFINGLGLEDSLLDYLSVGDGKVVALSESLKLDDSNDPHAWMNPQNVALWADRIALELSGLDPSRRNIYLAKAEAYREELDTLDQWAETQLAEVEPARRNLISDHEILTHFAQRFGFTIVGTLIPSTSTLGEPSASDLAGLENTIEKMDLSVIFVGSPESENLAAQVARDTGIALVSIYAETLSGPEGPASTYLEMMSYDVRTILSALDQE